MIGRRAAIGLTLCLSPNQNVDMRIILSKIKQRSHYIGQVVGAYIPSLSLTSIIYHLTIR